MSVTELKPIPDMTVAELRAELELAGVTAPSGTKKETLIRLVESSRTETGAEAPEQTEIQGEAELTADEPIEPAPALEPSAELHEAESQALVLREQAPVATSLLPSSAEFTALQEIAERIASTQMVPLAYRGKPDDVIAAFLTGREMGMGIMQSLREIHVIDGKPSLSANLLLARLREGGIMILESESNAQRAWIRARRRDTGEVGEVEWTRAEAEEIRDKKGQRLVDKANWKNYPADMLWARCVGRLARHIGPDLVGAAMPYSSEEVQDWDDFDAQEQRAKFGGDTKTGVWHGPQTRAEFAQRFAKALGGSYTEWLGQLAEIGYGFDSIRAVADSPEVPPDRKTDMWRRLGIVLEALESDDFALGPQRETIQKAFAKGFDGLGVPGPEAAESAPAAAEPSSDAQPAADAADAGAADQEAQAATDEEPLVDASGEPISF